MQTELGRLLSKFGCHICLPPHVLTPDMYMEWQANMVPKLWCIGPVNFFRRTRNSYACTWCEMHWLCDTLYINAWYTFILMTFQKMCMMKEITCMRRWKVWSRLQEEDTCFGLTAFPQFCSSTSSAGKGKLRPALRKTPGAEWGYQQRERKEKLVRVCTVQTFGVRP